ncbi:MAG: aldehyde dehydrogenase family protein [Caldilineaceae bacterium]
MAIKDLVYSAFGHNGQKCSAASLAVLEAEVYDSPTFLRQLKDAVASLPVGPAWDLSSQITPLIHPPAGPLAKRKIRWSPANRGCWSRMWWRATPICGRRASSWASSPARFITKPSALGRCWV